MRSRLLFFVATAIFSLAGAPAALGQVDYVGIPPPTGDPYIVTYVGTYAGPSPQFGGPAGGAGQVLAPPVSQAGANGGISVSTAALGESPQPVDEGDGRLVTGWDLVTMAAIGLGALAALAVPAGRFRST